LSPVYSWIQESEAVSEVNPRVRRKRTGKEVVEADVKNLR